MSHFRVRAVLLTFSLWASAAFAQSAPPPSEWLPDGAIAVIHISRPAAILDLAHELKLLDALLPPSPEVRAMLALFDGGGKTRTEPHGLIRKIAGGGLTYAIYPGENSVLLLDAADVGSLDRLSEIAQLLVAAQGQKGKLAYLDLPGGLRSLSIEGKYFSTRSGSRLAITNREAGMRALFDPQRRPALASSASFQQAMRSVPSASAGWAFANMAALKQHPPIRKGLASSASPFDILLNEALKEPLRTSTWLSLSLAIEGRGLTLHAATDGALSAAGVGAFTMPQGQGMLPGLTVPHQLASLSLWRDLGRFYAARETLFPEKTSGGILFENFMEIFFSGRDLKTEVFERFGPQIRVVAARQQYDAKVGTPDAQYPAAALIFRVDRNPEEFGELFEEAWQKAIGISNFTRGQQALPGLILDKSAHAGVPVTYCYYSPRDEKDRAHLPARFNVRPAIARTGPYLIVSSTDGLAKDVIDAVNREDGRMPASGSGTHTMFEITGPEEIAALLEANRAEMIRQSVVGKGEKPKAAEAEFERNLALLRRLAEARLSVGGNSADLELRFR
jgi:hypothetical protein